MQAIHDTSFASRLASIDLTAVMQHVVEDHGLSTADAARAEDLYRKYLTLRHTYPTESMVPPRIVDLVWHAHITFTRQYMADCDKLFGGYLHHNPQDADMSNVYQLGTVAKLKSDFGITMSSYMLDSKDAVALRAGGECD